MIFAVEKKKKDRAITRGGNRVKIELLLRIGDVCL